MKMFPRHEHIDGTFWHVVYQFALTVAIIVGFAIALEQLHITIRTIIGLIFHYLERCSCDTFIDYVGCLLFMFPRERLHKHPLSPRSFKLGTWVYNRGIVIELFKKVSVHAISNDFREWEQNLES